MRVFRTRISSLEESEEAARVALDTFEGGCRASSSAMGMLPGGGFVGAAQIASNAAFMRWNKAAGEDATLLRLYMIACSRAISDARDLKLRAQEVPAAVGAGGANSDEVTLAQENAGSLTSMLQGICDIDINEMNCRISSAIASATGVQGGGAIIDSLSWLSWELGDQHVKLSALKSAFSSYVSAVDAYENNMGSLFQAIAEGKDVDKIFGLLFEGSDLAASEGGGDNWVRQAIDKGDLVIDAIEAGRALSIGGPLLAKGIYKGRARLSADGKYVLLDQYKQGHGLTSRYRRDTLPKHDSANRIYKLGKVGKILGPVGYAVSVVDIGFTVNDTLQDESIPADRAASDAWVEIEMGAVSIGASVGIGALGGAIGGPVGIVIGAAGGLLMGFGSIWVDENLRNSGFVDAYKENRYKTLKDFEKSSDTARAVSSIHGLVDV